MPIDVKNLSGLNEYLKERSYIEGYAPSQADVTVFKALGAAPEASAHPHIARWYNHIQSYSNEHATLPGDQSKGLEALGPAGGFAAASAAAGGDDDDEIDLFGSDEEEDEEAEKLKAQRLEEYNKKKAAKPKEAAKSIITLDVKPWDDETDMKALEDGVRAIEMDGLVWGLSKLVPVGFGVSKLQINLVVEDEKVSTDALQEQIQELEDYVQSTDIAAMSKI